MKLSEIINKWDNYEKQLNTECNNNYTMTADQQFIINGVLSEYNNRSVKYGVLNSPSGCGKTTVIRALEKECEKRNISIAITASTGKAASALGGKTIHSYLSLKMVQNEEAESHDEALQLSTEISIDSSKKVDILVIDESSMIGQKMFSMIKSAGFNYVLFVLDASQLPPVKEKAIEWESLHCTQFKLTKTLRARDKDLLKLFEDFKEYRDGNKESLYLDDYVNGRNIISIDYDDMDYIPVNSECCSVAYRNKIVEFLVDKLTHKNHNMYNLNSGVTVTEIVKNEKTKGSDFITEQVFYNGEDVKIELLTNETVALVKNGYCYYKNFKINLSKNKMGINITNTDDNRFFHLKIPEDDFVEYTSLACIDDSYFVFLWDKSEDEYEELLSNEFMKLKPYLRTSREVKKIMKNKNFDLSVIDSEVRDIFNTSDSGGEFIARYKESDFGRNIARLWNRFYNVKAIVSARKTTSRTINKAQGISIPAVVVTDVSFYGASLSAQYVAVTRCKHCLILVKNVPNIVRGEV